MNQMTQYRNNGMPMAHFDTFSPTRNWRKPLFALLLIISLTGLGEKAWGQIAWHNNDHITGQNNWGIGGNITVTVDNGATVYIDGQIAPISESGQTRTVTIKVSGTNGTCTIRRGSGNTGALFNVYGSNNIYGSNFGAGNLVIQSGVTIDGGNIANCAPLIQVEEGGTCTLTKVTLQNNIAVQGAAIKNSGTLTATNCTIQNNAAADLGGGIFTTNSATLTSCTITGNTVNGGGGAGIYASEVLSCTSCTLSNNRINNSNGSGGGIYYCGSTNTTNKLTINGCTINGNSAGYKGGGIIMHVNGTNYCNGEIKGATNIYGNSAKDAGGLALHDPDVACTLSAGTIYGNSASRNGGGVYISTGSTLTYSGGDIGKTGSGNENTATSNGGGVYIQGNLVMSAGNILNNSADQGGGVYVPSTGTMTFNGGSIHDNSATTKGGGIYFNGSNFTMTGATARSIYSNSAANGGGVYVSGTFDASNAKLEIYSNTATYGGGIYSTGTLTLGGSLVGKSGGANTATSNGGGVYLESGATSISGGNVQYNTAVNGAGIYMNGGTTSITSGGSINNNAASQDGGGVYVNVGTFSVSASREIIKNTAVRNGGGVYVASGGTFNSNGLVGKSSNANTAERGAGVYTAGTLNIQGGNIQYNTMTGTAKLGSGVYIAGGTTTMSGGAINNHASTTAANNAIDGGGVYVNGGTFTMSSSSTGEIHTNTATGNGGGVYVASGSTFNYNGGVVGKSGGANQAANGGGVYVASNATFTMGSGTAVSYNTSSVDGAGIYLASNFTLAANRTINNNTATGNGGGIYVASGVTFTMNGGVIHTNTAKKNANYGDGGAGVYTEANTTFSMSGGEIYHNTCTDGAHGCGGGVLSNGTFNMSGGDIGRGTAIGNSSNRNLADHGGGVFVHNGTFTMSGTAQVHGNQAANGGGVYVNTNGSFVMNNGEIHFNYAVAGTQNNKGGGVYVVSGSTFTMNNGTIYSNQAKYSYQTTNDNNQTVTNYGWANGAGVSNSGTFTMNGGSIGKYENNTRYENKGNYGGGVYTNGTFNCTGGTIAYNAGASSGGGVYVVANSTFSFDNTTIHDNTSGGHGGGIWTAGSVTATDNNSLHNTKIYNNTVTGNGNDGGGVYVGNNGSFTMTNGEIYGNRTVDGGGGIYIVNQATSSASLTNTKVYGNSAAYGGGAYKAAGSVLSINGGEIYSNIASTNGGGINTAGGTVTLTGVSIGKEENNAYLPNTAKVGGGIYIGDGNLTIQKNSTTNVKSFIIGNNANAGDGTGGGIHMVTGTLSISDTEITGNTSLKSGGGIHVANNTALTISNCIISDNNATTSGGGIHQAAGTSTTITDSEISDNTATTTGGGIHHAAGTTNLTNCEISDNTATTTGGGIHLAGGTITNNNSSVSSNTSLTNGGGIYIAGGTLNLQNGSDVLNNIASSTGYGGGIYSNAGTLNVNSSSIQGNQSLVNGGGIYKKGTVNVSGVVVINNNISGVAKTQIIDNVYIYDGASQEYVNIAAAGLDCGSCIGVTKSHSYGSGNNSNVTEIVRGAGSAPVPANNCSKAYRNHFFFDDTDTHTVFNSTTSPYYNQAASGTLYFVKNTATNGKPTASSATDSWVYIADASGCTIDGNGFVTAVNNAAGMAYFAQHILAGNDYSGKTVVLNADIDLSGHNWEPMGYAAECLGGNGAIFNGTFDGQGHTIANITSPFPYDNMGLFGAVGDDGVVKNTVVANINFTGSNANKGAIAGLLNGSAYNCTAVTLNGTGATAASLVGAIGEEGSVKNCLVNTSATNGFADVNGGAIENCYMRGATAFVGSGSTGTVNYCYAPSGSASGTNSVYGATALVNGKYGFAHSDQQITANSDNSHIVNGAIDNRGELKGLLTTLNNWVRASGNGWNAGTQSNSNGYALWTRTMASPINGDYPVLMMPGTVCVGSPNGTLLDYASDVNTLMTSYTTSGNIYLYATNPTALGSTSGTTRVYINEHVGVLQTAGTTVNARVGITLDNSSTGYMSYDWHMFSSALTAANMGLVYHSGVGDTYYVKDNYSTLLSGGIPHSVYTSVANMDPTQTTWSTSNIGYFPTDTPYGKWRGTDDPNGCFDFYCYAEPYCHWINFKREGTPSFYDHWREPEDANHMHQNIPYENELTMTQGKGYLVDLSAPSMLMADGVLNNGDASGNVSVSVTATDINYTGYEYALKGVNLIGNPYQSYLDFDEFAANSNNTDIGNTYFILDADHHGYVSYTVGQSEPIAPQLLHPHQGFFVRVSSSRSLQFTPSMRETSGGNFRDDRPRYPLVNLVCSDSQGRNDFTTLELDRPEAGGGEKVSGLHAGDASIWLHLDDLEWQTAFTLPGLHEVPVRFRAYNDGMFTIGWETRNADISYMHLIDNLTGMDIDCLSASDYVFEGKTTDYWSRFRLVFEYTDVDENDDNQTDSGTFAFMNGDELVVNGPSSSSSTSILQMFDLNGRCIFAKELHGTQNIVSPPKMAPGIYILRLTNNLGTKTQKMVIK